MTEEKTSKRRVLVVEDEALIAIHIEDTLLELGNVNFTLTNSILQGLGTDGMTSIESANLTGGSGNNVLDASAFTLGPVTLDGGAGNDTLRGSRQNDVLLGGSGNDSITGGLGDDWIDGGAGFDALFESGDVDLLLSNAALLGLGSDLLAGLESANLIGGISNNLLDASAFSFVCNTIAWICRIDLCIPTASVQTPAPFAARFATRRCGTAAP